MSVNYYMFLEEVRLITSQLDVIEESNNEKVLKSFFFIDDLISKLKNVNNLLMGK
ncbi:MAG: hypothetical protein ACFFA7_12330 [Promethearchaeota archaeon]